MNYKTTLICVEERTNPSNFCGLYLNYNVQGQDKRTKNNIINRFHLYKVMA